MASGAPTLGSVCPGRPVTLLLTVAPKKAAYWISGCLNKRGGQGFVSAGVCPGGSLARTVAPGGPVSEASPAPRPPPPPPALLPVCEERRPRQKMLVSSSTCLFSGLCATLLAVALAYYFYW